MKRLILSVAILAVAASCSKNEVTDVPQTNAITFTTLNDRVLSRTATDDAEAMYQLYAVRSENTTENDGNSYGTIWYINDYSTAFSTSGDTFNYGPYFWPADGDSLAFYAYAPYNSSCISNTESGSTITAASEINLKYTVNSNASEDFTVATPVTETYQSEVSLQFNHMLAKAVVKVVLAENLVNQGYTLDWKESTSGSATLSVPNETGTVDVMDAIPALTVTPGTARIGYTNSCVDVEKDSNYDYSYASFMFMPQSSITDGLEATLSISGVKIYDQSTQLMYDDSVAATYASIATYTFKADDVETTTDNKDNFSAGYQYIITVTIGADAEDTDSELIFGTPIVAVAASPSWSDIYVDIVDANQQDDEEN